MCFVNEKEERGLWTQVAEGIGCSVASNHYSQCPSMSISALDYPGKEGKDLSQ